MVSDPVADMLTRIRNASKAGYPTVAVPGAKMQLEIARVLKEDGYIQGYKTEASGPGIRLDIELKPRTDRGRAINGLKRISRPGRARLRPQDQHPPRPGRAWHRRPLHFARPHERPAGPQRRPGRRGRLLHLVT